MPKFLSISRPKDGKQKRPEHLIGFSVHQIVNGHDVARWLKKLQERDSSPEQVVSFFESYLKFNKDFIWPDAEGEVQRIIAHHGALARRRKLAVA